MGFTNWQERAEKAEDVLRSLASFVGAGGYNADKVNADMFEQKIRWGIGQIMERPEKAEAELKAAREQDPVAEYDGVEMSRYTLRGIDDTQRIAKGRAAFRASRLSAGLERKRLRKL